MLHQHRNGLPDCFRVLCYSHEHSTHGHQPVLLEQAIFNILASGSTNFLLQHFIGNVVGASQIRFGHRANEFLEDNASVVDALDFV